MTICLAPEEHWKLASHGVAGRSGKNNLVPAGTAEFRPIQCQRAHLNFWTTRAVDAKSGAKVTALQTLRAVAVRLGSREAFGVRRVHRRFPGTTATRKSASSSAVAGLWRHKRRRLHDNRVSYNFFAMTCCNFTASALN